MLILTRTDSTLLLALGLAVSVSLFAGCSTEEETSDSSSTTTGPTTGTTTTGTTATTTGTSTSTSTGTTTGGGNGGSMDPSCGAESDPCDFMTDVFTYCVENHCGTEENFDIAFCSQDERIGCFCLTGACSREQCVESGTCTLDAAGDEQCLGEAAAACGGAEFVREAFCTLWGLEIQACEWLCSHGTSPACDPTQG